MANDPRVSTQRKKPTSPTRLTDDPGLTRVVRSPRERLSPQQEQSALLRLASELEAGNFSARAPENLDGFLGKIATRLNSLAHRNQTLVQELARLSAAVG